MVEDHNNLVSSECKKYYTIIYMYGTCVAMVMDRWVMRKFCFEERSQTGVSAPADYRVPWYTVTQPGLVIQVELQAEMGDLWTALPVSGDDDKGRSFHYWHGNNQQ